MGPQPPSPLTVSTVLYFILLPPVLLFFQRPTRSTGSADTRWPAATAADLGKKKQLATQLSSPFRDPAGLLVRSPGKPYHTTFLTVAGIPRRFSSAPPENLVTQLSSPWLHSAGLLVRSGLSTPGPRRRVFSRILRFAPRPGTQAGNQAGNQARLSPLRDSAPSLYIIFCMISCDSAPCPDDWSSQES